VKKPTVDNRRFRFLTRQEADRLLALLATKSTDVHEMALLALHSGMRAGEIFSLEWQDVDTAKGIMILRNTKSGKTRAAFMTQEVKAMLDSRSAGIDDASALVFPGRKGKKIIQISESFNRAVDELGFEQGSR
jgi:integrase